MQRVRDHGTLRLNGAVSIKYLLSGLRKPIEKEIEKFKSHRSWMTPRKQDLLNKHDKCRYELTETKTACIGVTGVCNR